MSARKVHDDALANALAQPGQADAARAYRDAITAANRTYADAFEAARAAHEAAVQAAIRAYARDLANALAPKVPHG